MAVLVAFFCCGKHHDHKQLGEETIYFILQSFLKARWCRTLTPWLAQLAFLYHAGGTTPWWAGLFPSIINQQNDQQTCLQAIC